MARSYRILTTIVAVLSSFVVSLAAAPGVPSDGDLVRGADAIVLGRVISQRSFLDSDGLPRTEFNVGIEEVLKGVPGDRYVRITELGGVVNGRGGITSGAAHFLQGERALIFLQKTDSTRWRTLRSGLGKFTLGFNSDGEERFVRGPILGVVNGNGFQRGTFENKVRDAGGFLEFVRATVRNSWAKADYSLSSESVGDIQIQPTDGVLPEDYAFLICCDEMEQLVPVRWPDFDRGSSVTMYTNGAQAGFDGILAADRALTAWNSDAGSRVSYRRGGSTSTGFNPGDGTSVIVFNSSDTENFLVFTWFWVDGMHTFAGRPWYSLSEFDIALADFFEEISGVNQAILDESLTFGMGLGLGFRIADEPGRTPQGTEQTSVIHNPITGEGAVRFGATLGSYDRDALASVYPTGGSAPDPIINSFGASPVQIRAGGSTTLIWSTENADSVQISPSVGTVASSGRTTVSPTSTTTYSLLASNELGKMAGLNGTASKTVRVEVLQNPEVIISGLPKQMVQGTGEGGATTTFTVQNVGGASTTVSLLTSDSFYAIDDTSFSLSPGASKTVTITGMQRSTGDYNGVIDVVGNGVPSGTRVRVKMLAVPAPDGPTSAKAEVARIDLASMSGDNTFGTARYKNDGPSTIVGVLVADVPWLIPESGLIQIAPGETEDVTFTIDRTRIPGGETIGSRSGSLQFVFRSGPAGKGPSVHDGVGSIVSNVLVVDTTTPTIGSNDPSGIGVQEVAMFAPGVGHVEGSTGLFISDLSMTFLSSSGTLGDVGLFYTKLCGIPCTGGGPLNAVSSDIDSIPANTPIALADIVNNVYDKDAELGSLQIRGPSPDLLSVSANILNTTSDEGTFGTTIPILRSDRSAGPGESIYIPGLRKTPTGHTNVFIQETGGGDVTITTKYFDVNGNSLGSRTDPVAAFRMIGFFDGPGRPINEGGTPDGAVSVVISNDITSAGKISAYATPVDRSRAKGGDFWSLVDWNRQLAQSGSDPMLIPVAGFLAGGNNTFFQTDGYALNNGTTTATAEVKYIYTDLVTNTPNLVKTANITVQPGATALMENIVTKTLAVANNSVGYIIFTPKSGTFAVTSRTYTTEEGKESTLGTGVTTLPRKGLSLGQVRRIGGIEASAFSTILAKSPGTFRTNFALIETTGTDSVKVRVTVYYDIASTSLAVARGSSSKEYTLTPGQFLSKSRIVEEIVGPARQTSLGDLHNVQAEFVVIEGAGQLAVWVSSADNGTGDTITRTE